MSFVKFDCWAPRMELNFNNVHTQIYNLKKKNSNHFERKLLEFCYWITFQWPFFGKNNLNTWFVNGKTFVANTWINKIHFSYLKHSFNLVIYIIQFCFQYIIILPITFNLDVWGVN